ncbi:unnamed protein product [Leptosia nina]|uniref:Uncharacterized protein n=1 Tax=Leptosia nina TaxID=320188 RepID=A0AAV1J2Q3_9NEOP
MTKLLYIMLCVCAVASIPETTTFPPTPEDPPTVTKEKCDLETNNFCGVFNNTNPQHHNLVLETWREKSCTHMEQTVSLWSSALLACTSYPRSFVLAMHSS